MIKQILCDIVEKEIESAKEVAVLFSGGIDSLSLCFALENLHINIHTYTFRLDSLDSEDAQYSRAIAEKCNWNHTEIIVPTTEIRRDFLRLTHDYHCNKKTLLECTFPFLYVIPEIKENFVLSGVAVGGLYVLSKTGMMHFKNKLQSFRAKYYSQNSPAGVEQLRQLCQESYKKLIAPYLDFKVKQFFSKFTWNEMNKPMHKKHVIEDFEQFQKIRARVPSNLQLNAGIPEHFEKLLNDKELNYLNRKRILDMCRDHSK